MPRPNITARVPWSRSQGWSTEGPEGPIEFELHGHRFRVSPTEFVEEDLGKTRMRVECLTCGETVHEATIGPRFKIQKHLDAKVEGRTAVGFRKKKVKYATSR